MARSVSGRVHLGELQAYPHRDRRKHEGAQRSGSHRPRELAVRLLPVATVHGEPGLGGIGQPAEDVVLQSELIDGGEGTLQVFGRLDPLPSIHRQHRQLGLAEDDGVDIAPSGAHGGRLHVEGSRPVTVAEEQLRLGTQAQRRGAPRAPGRLLGGGEARIGQHLLGTGTTHGSPQHGPRRVEGFGAVHRHQVERSGVEECRPPFRLDGLAGVHRHPSGQDRERGILLDDRRSECRQPAQHG